MTDAEYRRSLLLTRIDAHRDLLRLELRLARRQFDPWRAVFSLLGGAIVPVLVAALLPLVDRFRGNDVGPRDGDDLTAGPRSG